MARQYKQKSIVSGLSVQDILNMDLNTFNKLNTRDLQKVVGRLVSAGNKRMRRLEEDPSVSPALRELRRSGGPFSTKGKDLNALRAEFVRARNFMNMQSSSRRSWNKVKRDVLKSLKGFGVKEITPEQYDRLFDIFDKLKELNPDVAMKEIRYDALKAIASIVDDDVDIEQAAQKILPKVNEIYEQNKKEEEERSGVSQFYEQQKDIWS